MDTNQSGQKLNWVQLLRQLPNRYQVSFTQMLKTASGISRGIYYFAIIFMLGLLYRLFFRLEELDRFVLPLSEIDILPLTKAAPNLFHLLLGFEMIFGLILAYTFWNLEQFIKSIDPLRPFSNSKSKKFIGRVAWMAQAFFVAKVLFRITVMQGPHEFLLSQTSELIGFGTNEYFFPFNYLILAYFVSIFSQIFKRGITIHNELEEVI